MRSAIYSSLGRWTTKFLNSSRVHHTIEGTGNGKHEAARRRVSGCSHVQVAGWQHKVKELKMKLAKVNRKYDTAVVLRYPSRRIRKTTCTTGHLCTGTPLPYQNSTFTKEPWPGVSSLVNNQSTTCSSKLSKNWISQRASVE